MKKNLFIFLFFLSPIFVWAQQEVLPESVAANSERMLIRNGVFPGAIYVAENCEMEELQAAYCLANWISRVVGCEMPPLKEENPSAGEPVKIFVGKTSAAAKAKVFPPVAEGETFVIEFSGNSIFIVGKTTTATWHGVAHFLTDTLGVEFVFPGEDGAEWSPKKNVVFPRNPVAFVPPWISRSVSLRGNETWGKMLGFGERPHFSHNLYSIFNPELYKAHPSLAPVVNGKTQMKKSGGYAPQPNLSSSLAPEEAYAASQRYFERNPGAPMFALGINDSTNWDESEASAAVFGKLKYFRNLPDRSNYFYDFVNKTARRVSASSTFPGKRVGVIAYLDVQNAPTFLVEKNVVPVLCADRSMWVFPEFKADDMALMRRWEKSGVEMWGIYDYYYGLPFLFPRQFFKEQAESLKFAYKHGARIFYAEINPIIPFDAPKIWLTAKLLQNPDADADAMLARFFDLAYGDASRPMRDFFEMCEAFWREQGGQCRWIKGYMTENSFEIFPPEKCAALSKKLKEARELFPDAPTDDRSRRIVSRIASAIENFNRTELFSKDYFARKKLQTETFQTVESIADSLRDPAWRATAIYDEQAWRDAGFPHSLMRKVDPRPAAFFSLIHALSQMPKSADRSRIEDRLEQFLRIKNTPPNTDDNLLAFLSEALPAMLAAPTFSDSFEPTYSRSPEDGEWVEKSIFTILPQVDWKQGKQLGVPAGWKPVFAASERVAAGEVSCARTGKSALRITGGCELAQYSREFKVRAGQRFVAHVWCRGEVDCGSEVFLSFLWKNNVGLHISKPILNLMPVGDNKTWMPLVICGIVPEKATSLEIALGASYQALGSEVIFDDFSLFIY